MQLTRTVAGQRIPAICAQAQSSKFVERGRHSRFEPVVVFRFMRQISIHG